MGMMVIMSKAKKLQSGNWRVQVFAGKDENVKQIRRRFISADKREAEFMAAKLSPKTVANVYVLLSATLKVYAPDLNFKITLPAKRKIIKEMPNPSEIMKIMTTLTRLFPNNFVCTFV